MICSHGKPEPLKEAKGEEGSEAEEPLPSKESMCGPRQTGILNKKFVEQYQGVTFLQDDYRIVCFDCQKHAD
jgi:hypothetical protein